MPYLMNLATPIKSELSSEQHEDWVRIPCSGTARWESINHSANWASISKLHMPPFPTLIFGSMCQGKIHSFSKMPVSQLFDQRADSEAFRGMELHHSGQRSVTVIIVMLPYWRWIFMFQTRTISVSSTDLDVCSSHRPICIMYFAILIKI